MRVVACTQVLKLTRHRSCSMFMQWISCTTRLQVFPGRLRPHGSQQVTVNVLHRKSARMCGGCETHACLLMHPLHVKCMIAHTGCCREHLRPTWMQLDGATTPEQSHVTRSGCCVFQKHAAQAGTTALTGLQPVLVTRCHPSS